MNFLKRRHAESSRLEKHSCKMRQIRNIFESGLASFRQKPLFIVKCNCFESLCLLTLLLSADPLLMREHRRVGLVFELIIIHGSSCASAFGGGGDLAAVLSVPVYVRLRIRVTNANPKSNPNPTS